MDQEFKSPSKQIGDRPGLAPQVASNSISTHPTSPDSSRRRESAGKVPPPPHTAVVRSLQPRTMPPGRAEIRQERDRQIQRGNAYFVLTFLITLLSAWFIGPRLVEEYYYAASRGEARAEYDHAVEHLDQGPLNNVSLAYQLVAQRIKPSVVSLRVAKNGRSGDMEGIGSGVIFSEDGHIVTNAHVVKNGLSFEVRLYNRRVYLAELVGIDADSDIAVLKIDAPNLVPANWGDSDKVDVGSMVWAVGSPYGFQHTITSGILSGKDRPGGDSNHFKQSLLQTDAAVNPGNSGGPLVDAQGHVIGINTSIFGETFQGISFAVPSATAKFVFDELVKNGRVVRGYLGVYPLPVDSRQVDYLKLPDLNGAQLINVLKGSPADRAGIRQGDIIRTFNGEPICSERDLFRLAESTPPNSTVVVSFLRDGLEYSTQVKMAEKPESNQPTLPSDFFRGVPTITSE